MPTRHKLLASLLGRRVSPRRASSQFSAQLGVERLEPRSLLSASPLAGLDGGAWHFEDALYGNVESGSAPRQQGPHAQGGGPENYDKSIDVVRSSDAVGHPRPAAGGSRQNALNAVFPYTPVVHVVLFTWRQQVTGNGPAVLPPALHDDAAEIAEQVNFPGGSRRVAATAPQSTPGAPPSTQPDAFSSDAGSSIQAAGHWTELLSTLTSSSPQTRSSQVSSQRAHEAAYQTLAPRSAGIRQEIDASTRAFAAEDDWARTDADRDFGADHAESDIDAMFASTSFASLRHITDHQADRLADLLDDLPQRAAHTSAKTPGEDTNSAEPNAESISAASAHGQSEAAGAPELNEYGGMVLLRTVDGAGNANDVIDAIDAALASDDLDRLLAGELGAVETSIGTRMEASHYADGDPQTASRAATANSGGDSSKRSHSAASIPLAALGVGVLAVAARGNAWRDMLKLRREAPRPSGSR